MDDLFTDYLRRLDPVGAPPDQACFDRIWEALRRLAENELRRRGLWEASPSYLGIIGRSRWWEGGNGVGARHDDALDELVAELYPFIFVSRLGKLLDHLRLKPSIDGLVRLNLRHLLHERQKRHDPVGFRVFEITREAVHRALSIGVLVQLGGDRRVRNDTILGCCSSAVVDSGTPVLSDVVGEWNDTLLPALVNGKGRAREETIEALRTYLGTLMDLGIERFTFRDLVDPLKADARWRWALRWAPRDTGLEGDAGDVGAAAVVPLVPPSTEVEERESLAQLDRCLTESIARRPADDERDDLSTLWRALRRSAVDDDIPSRRRLAADLGIPRRRLTRLFTILGEMVEDCRNSRDTMPTARTVSGGAGTMDGSDRVEALRRQTGQARRRHAEREVERTRRARQPAVGQIIALAASAEQAVEWVLVRPEGDGFFAVPADISPLVGPTDVAIPATVEGGPLVLRSAYGLELPTAVLDGAQDRGSLPQDWVVRAREAVGRPTEPIADSELDDWLHDVIAPAHEAVRAAARASAAGASATPAGRPGSSVGWRRWAQPMALAASLVFVLGLGVELVEQRRLADRTTTRLDQLAGENDRLARRVAAGRDEIETLRKTASEQRAEVERLQQVERQLEQQLARPPQPTPTAKPNVVAGQIEFESTRRQTIKTLTLPIGTDDVTLLFNIAEFGGFDRYRIEVESGSKSPRFDVDGLDHLVSLEDNLTVVVPAAWLPAGTYTFRLFGRPPGARGETYVTTTTWRIEWVEP